MILTTTPSIEGRPIREYLGVVTGEAILGAHLGKDFLAGLTNMIGGRSREYEQELGQARDTAFQEVVEGAKSVGANAVVGIDIDYEVLGANNGMLMVCVSGTAVVVK
jgi:uncharacterized protein YbjQ (UPF0145 family)